ncbi:type II toxin-antitoxin system VapC family toxin [Tianweitania sp. BSSL-BM11]|uniref:Type II toxin-antitoxin system VapC family toxin n=1 Tax=Tianweitania aestuarii TaxID=2814886 RepID=A0ABS5RZV0_9HYPH|nr:type II toxin-antitoxin system VapC family toxin [Tianweitania aestuarii]MBS9722575.1 type II toxin-antitoxin system VapC family toxin [Tianweitania aestuarii]
MKTSTLIDTNILIDIFGSGPLHPSSADALEQAMHDGPIVLSAVVWAEFATPGLTEEQLWRKLQWLKPQREDFPFEAAYPAGLAHRTYKARGGLREKTLPDFLIGAHALVGGHRLLTRDVKRYRTYFPDLDLIAPDTHP